MAESKKFHFYLVKFISIGIFIYSCWLVYAASYSIYTLKMSELLSIELEMQTKSLIGYAGLIVIVGLIGLVGATGLIFFKKFGFYLTNLSILILWLLSLVRVNGISQDWPELMIATIIFIYLIFSKKFIFEHSPSSSIQ